MRCHTVHFQLRGDHYMQFTFNKTCFLAWLHCEEPLLAVTVHLDEIAECVQGIDALLLASGAVSLQAIRKWLFA